MKPARPWMLAHLKIIWQFHAHPVHQKVSRFFGPRYLFIFFFLFVSSIVRNLHSYKSPYITTWHGCTRIYSIIIKWLLHFFKVNYRNKQNMTWINKSIETHSFFHILSLPFITKPIPLQCLSSTILWQIKYIIINNIVYRVPFCS